MDQYTTRDPYSHAVHLPQHADAWLGHFRRLAKEVEILTGTAENRIRIAMLKTTLGQSAKKLFPDSF